MAKQAITSIDNAYTSLLTFSSTASLPLIRKNHAQILKTGVSNDIHLATKLVSLYALRFHFSDAGCLLNSLNARMVNLLGRVGRLEDAYKMITQMPAEPDARVWIALLSICRIHGDVILGETAAEELFRLEPRNAGSYVLLSNKYASKGMWDGVDRMRERMKHIGLKKQPDNS